MGSSNPPWPGELDGRFEYISDAGKGSYSRVYRVFDRREQRPAALKMLTRADSQVRFKREIDLLRQISHENVVAYISHGRAETGHLYVALEWLEGKDLGSLSGMQEGFSQAESVRFVVQAARGLAEIHRLGIVHRDIKPSNLFVCNDTGSGRHAKVIDLGIAQHLTFKTITKAGALLGTPSYMSPDLASGDSKVTAASDVYSLCAVLYEMVTGQKVHRAEQLWELVGQILFHDPIAPIVLNHKISEALNALLLKGLSKNPANRFPDCNALASALTALGSKQRKQKRTSLPRMPKTAPGPVSQRIVALLLYQMPESRIAELDQREAFIEKVRQTVEDRAGTVATIQGNGLLGLFGMTKSYGDEITRALVTGQRLLAVYEGKAAVALGKINVHTGPAHILAKAASLFEDREENGTIWIDREVARRVQLEFDLEEDRGIFLVKTRNDWAAFRDGAMVGRDAALERLNGLLKASLRGRHPAIALIMAEDGMGKSRLLRQILRDSRALGFQVTNLAVAAEFRERPYALIGALLKKRAGISEEFSPEFGERILRRFLPNLSETNDTILGIFYSKKLSPHKSDGEILHWQVSDMVQDVIRRDLTEGPILWLIDDLHNSDLISVEILADICRTLKGRLVLMTSARPGDPDRNRSELFGDLELVKLQLAPLKPAVAALLVKKIAPNLSEENLNSIVRRADGNPMFMEELVFLYQKGSSARAVTRGIQAAVQATLDCLPATAVNLARIASILGASGPLDALAHLAPEVDLAHWGCVLIEGNIWGAMPVSTDWKSGRFTFRHQITRDAVYDLFASQKRTATHLAAGKYFDKGEKRDPRLAAHHYLIADFRTGAVRCLLEAAQWAHALVDSRTTLRMTDQLLKLGVERDDRHTTLFLRARAKTWDGRLDEGFRLVQTLLTDAEASSRQRVRAACLGCLQLRRLSRVEEGLRFAEIAVVEAAITGEPRQIAQAFFHGAFANYDAGNAAGISACLEDLQAMDHSLPLIDSLYCEVVSLHALTRGNFERSYQASRKCFEINCRIKRFSRVGANTANAGLGLSLLGRFVEALPYLRRAREIYQKQNNYLQLYDAMMNEGRILGELGEYEAALACLEKASTGLKTAGEHHFLGVTLALRARVLALRGTAADREESLDIVQNKLRPGSHSAIHALEQHVAVIDVALLSDNPHLAVDHGIRSLELLAKTGDHCEIAGEALAFTALLLDRCRHPLADQARERALQRLRFHMKLSVEAASREGLLQNVRGLRDFFKTLPRAERKELRVLGPV